MARTAARKSPRRSFGGSRVLEEKKLGFERRRN